VLTGEFHQRLARIESLGTQLSEPQLARLLDWLQTPQPEPGEATFKNDLLNVLRRQDKSVPGLSACLRAIYADPTHSLTMRDYALQHLAALGEDQDTLWQATAQRDGSLAGTALLALARAGADPDRLRPLALQLASDHQASELTRLPALRVCAQFACPEAVELARDLLHARVGFSLKLAAIATLGDLGEPADIPQLRALELSGPHWFRPATARALALLEAKTRPSQRSGS
jgi:hypothetical protein